MLISSGDTEYITDPYGNVVSAYSGDDYYVYSSDIQGSTACITDGDNISAEYEYSDFGEAATTADESFFNEIGYTGAVYDNATGMYYMRARYYEPGTGRFITQDTYRGEVSDSNTWHLYAYCSNDPVNYTDPSGHRYVNKSKEFSYYNPKKNSQHINRFRVSLTVKMTVVGKQIKTKRIETEILEMPWWENIVRKPVRQTCPYVNKKKQSIHIQLAWLYITFGTDINGIYDPPKAYHVFESTCNWEGKFSSTVGKIVTEKLYSSYRWGR